MHDRSKKWSIKFVEQSVLDLSMFDFYDMFLKNYPTALTTAYGQRPKFVRAEHSATDEGENCAYGPTLSK